MQVSRTNYFRFPGYWPDERANEEAAEPVRVLRGHSLLADFEAGEFCGAR